MRRFANKIQNMGKVAMARVQNSVCNRSGESYVDTGVKILIAVVIGALLLAGLYALFNNVVMPTLSRRITDMFNYHG